MEPIKQEIINNIFENGDKLITGPILQTVLIDMIDDVNVKDQEILSKTGSWDDAATQIPNLATKAEVTNLSESVARDLTGYATEQWVESQGYLTEHQDISGLATKTELNEAKNNLQGNITSLSESVARDLANVDVDLTGYATEAWVQSQDYASKSYVDNAVSSSSVDLTGYATETWVESQGYLKEHQDISNLATKSELNSVSESIQTDISNLATKGELTEAKNILEEGMIDLSGSVAKTIDDYTAGLITEIQNQDYASKTYVNEAVAGINLSDYATKSELTSVSESVQTDISNLATKTELNEAKDNLQGNITSLSESVARDLTGYATETWVQSQGYLKEHQDISGLATKTELTSVSESVQTDITNLSESVANSAVWKKGEGPDSVVQKLTGAGQIEPIATGKGAVATGIHTTASGGASHAEGEGTKALDAWSHAEGNFTEASGRSSHAEGEETVASGIGSHAEGYHTIATNTAEHAQGQYNYTSSNQIFSVGVGEKIGETVTRRNAVSILAVPNADSKIPTASFFVQNIGGYDGTNPEPGTNDLATVVSKVSSIWKKGTGTDSVVQILTGDNEAKTSTASGVGAIATGYNAKALGLASHAKGYKTEASGICSHAEGRITKATGHYSHAEGNQTTATGDASHAEGYATTALSSDSHAEGYATNTLGNWSHAEGHFTIASGSYSHAEGYFTKALGYVSHAEGAYTTASGDHSHAEGRYTTASGYYSHAEGHGTTTPGTSSHAEGAYAITSGSFSHAEGAYTTASGDYSHAEGDHTNASGYISHAEGAGTTALGQYSHAEGQNTNASGFGSHTEGAGTTALGQYSHAEGDNTVASGSNSHAEGSHTMTSNDYEHAQGRYNYTSSNQIFSIGTGNSDTDRRNAVSVLEVDNSGSYTSSFFVQNVGGYDGTNPTPGTNDLATVINGMSSGGSSETLWKKGTESDSIVQILTGADEAYTPTASGIGSIATGYATTASGYSSHAEGDSTNASGDSSHAEGSLTTASANYSHAEGDHAIASGEGSHAEGAYTEASGGASHAEGLGTITTNIAEHAQGTFNHSSENQIFSVGVGEGDPTNPETANRRNAIAVLNNDRLTGSVFVQNIGGYDGTNPTPGTNDLATVINNLSSSVGSSSGGSSGGGSSETLWKKGTGTDSIVQVIADGTNLPTASGPRAIAVGYDTTASGDYSHAEGLRTVASKYSSHAEGQDTIASGVVSHAEGDSTKASGAVSHAEGYSTTASGDYSHAEGFYTIASGNWSHAEGYYTTASGESSHAEGGYTTTSNQYEHAQGQYNHNSTNQIFSVGAGENANGTVTRRNAISVLAVPNSDTQINTASVFVQNVGGYDGTNPIPGTNDLATVINGMSTGGGGESGDYLPLTGGTLTGDLRVNSSMGVGTGPQGTHCLAVGDSNTNTGGSHYALAVGENCQVAGAYGGVSLGRENVVDAAFGLATGFRCRTTYMAGYAGGCRSTASANFAFAAGFGAEATRVGQVVLGAYNELDPSGDNESTGSYAVILANGKSDTWHQDYPGNITRSNGLAIKWDGGIDIKYRGSTVTLQDKLNEIEAKISSGGTATSTETWTFTLEDGSTVTKNIVMR